MSVCESVLKMRNKGFHVVMETLGISFGFDEGSCFDNCILHHFLTTNNKKVTVNCRLIFL